MQVHPDTRVSFSNPPERVRLNPGIPFRKQERRVPPRKAFLNPRQMSAAFKTFKTFKAPKSPPTESSCWKNGRKLGQIDDIRWSNRPERCNSGL